MHVFILSGTKHWHIFRTHYNARKIYLQFPFQHSALLVVYNDGNVTERPLGLRWHISVILWASSNANVFICKEILQSDARDVITNLVRFRLLVATWQPPHFGHIIMLYSIYHIYHSACECWFVRKKKHTATPCQRILICRNHCASFREHTHIIQNMLVIIQNMLVKSLSPRTRINSIYNIINRRI